MQSGRQQAAIKHPPSSEVSKRPVGWLQEREYRDFYCQARHWKPLLATFENCSGLDKVRRVRLVDKTVLWMYPRYEVLCLSREPARDAYDLDNAH